MISNGALLDEEDEAASALQQGNEWKQERWERSAPVTAVHNQVCVVILDGLVTGLLHDGIRYRVAKGVIKRRTGRGAVASSSTSTDAGTQLNKKS